MLWRLVCVKVENKSMIVAKKIQLTLDHIPGIWAKMMTLIILLVWTIAIAKARPFEI